MQVFLFWKQCFLIGWSFLIDQGPIRTIRTINRRSGRLIEPLIGLIVQHIAGLYIIYVWYIYHILYIYIVDKSSMMTSTTRWGCWTSTSWCNWWVCISTSFKIRLRHDDFHYTLPPSMLIYASSAKSQRNKASRFEHSAEERRWQNKADLMTHLQRRRSSSSCSLGPAAAACRWGRGRLQKEGGRCTQPVERGERAQQLHSRTASDGWVGVGVGVRTEERVGMRL